MHNYDMHNYDMKSCTYYHKAISDMQTATSV